MKSSLKILVIALLLVIVGIPHGSQVVARDGDNAGVVITNHAEVTYRDESGVEYRGTSPTVTVTIQTVAGLTVTPDETVPSATVVQQERITRLFRICNTGNASDSYTITNATVNSPASIVNLYFDIDSSGTLTAADILTNVNGPVSPQVSPGTCLGVLVTVDVNDSTHGTRLTISLTAQSNINGVNGRLSDEGTIINSVGAAPRLTSPSDSSLPPEKSVNGSSLAVVALGNSFTYTIALRNSGEAPALNVVITDELQPQIQYIPGSLTLDNRSITDADDGDEGTVTGQRIVLRLSTVTPGQIVRVTFRAQLVEGTPAGVGVANVALVSGQNISPTTSSTALVVVDPFGTVFAGRGGSAARIPGAIVALLLDQNEASVLNIPPGVGFPPNLENQNPYATDALGRFSFALLPEQLGTEASPARYFIRVSKPGYSTRMLEITIQPTPAGLFSLIVRALDGQPLARAGGFELVREDVIIPDMASVALNIPMFEPTGLEISKSVDRPRVEVGDSVAYRVEIRNPTAGPVLEAIVNDRLPASFLYVPGTARLTVGTAIERIVEPEVAGGELVFRVGDIPAGATVRLVYRARVGPNARVGEEENVAVSSGRFATGETVKTTPARASVFVGGGVFTTRQIILGRVFVDENRNGLFDENDKPLPGVRLYLHSGQSVVTDSQGLYNLPSLGDGSQVISLDPVTLPERYQLADNDSLAGRSWTRLLRTPLGGGSLLRQNFVLLPKDKTTPQSSPLGVKNDGSSSEAIKAAPSNPELATARTVTEFITTETLEPVMPGEVKVLSPAPNTTVMSPALQIEARVALLWKVRVEVNGKPISDQNIGTVRQDQKNSVTTFTYVGIELRPGANGVKVVAISPDGVTGNKEELAVLGRGPAQRLEIVPERTEIQSGGRDSTYLRIRAFDQWGSPAADDQVAVETSAGTLWQRSQKGTENRDRIGSSLRTNTSSLPDLKAGPDGQSQIIVSLVQGEAVVKLLAPGAPGEARLRAQMGQAESETKVRIVAESRPAILIGLAEMTVGQSVPEVNLREEEGHYRNRLSFFYSGPIGERNLLTLSYDSQRPINRTGGRDRLFQLDPLDRVYPLFGDSSTRYEAAQSNSKLYARLDRKRSYAMFGDIEADMEDLALVGYSRKLTGLKLHVENSQGDFVSVTGARPDTAFARDVFAAGTLGILRLSHGEVLSGSETVVLEVRDRRNPELILSRETLVRSVDYNLNPITGELFFLRYISAFDFNFNLTQLVVTYEHQAAALSSAVYTARARKRFNGSGLQLGFAAIVQRQDDAGSFWLSGIDGEQGLPQKGRLRFAFARSQGEILGSGNFFENAGDRHDGNAFQVELNQPLNFYQGVLRARYSYASAAFLNPFGATVTPGARRGEVSLELKPLAASLLRFGVTQESNRTPTVDNDRLTLSAAYEQLINDRVRLYFGYDHRSFDNSNAISTVESNLLTAGAELKLTDRLQLSVKREQNLSEADPSYPDQTTIAATYQLNQWAKVFLTQRLASATIMPIADFSGSGAGFTSSGGRRETAVGIETRIGKYTSMVGRYQLENGINGVDSFAVIGLQNRLPVTEQLSLELGFERGFHVAGNGETFNSATFGFGWQPNKDFRSSARYELRDRAGLGHLFAFGAAGRINEDTTALSRFHWARSDFLGRRGSSLEGTAAIAFRPLSSDRAGLLFSFTHRSLVQDAANGATPTRDRLDALASDGYFQATNRLELYGRLALRLSANGQENLPFVSTVTYLTQARIQYRLARRLDWAGELRYLIQPSSRSYRSVHGTEFGFWVLPDLRVGLGYNFSVTGEPAGLTVIPARRGFYFTLSSKLSRLFDLFGTANNGLTGSATESDGGTR